MDDAQPMKPTGHSLSMHILQLYTSTSPFSLLLYAIMYNAMALIRVPFVHGFYSLCTDQMKWLSAHTGFNISTMLVFHASQNFSGWKLASWFIFCCSVLCVALKIISYEIDTNLLSLPFVLFSLSLLPQMAYVRNWMCWMKRTSWMFSVCLLPLNRMSVWIQNPLTENSIEQ